LSKLGTILYKRNKRNIEVAYNDYTNKIEGAEDTLFKEIIKFAKREVSKKMFDVLDDSSAVDEQAQEIAITIWQKLNASKDTPGAFNGGPEVFYAWLHRICYTRSIDALNEIATDAKKYVPLLVEAEDGSGFSEDNPILHGKQTHKQNGKPVYGNNERATYRRALPDFIKGNDLKICEYIRYSGYDYAKIASLIGLKESAVEIRVRRMRNKIEEMKNAKG